jgi:hypothetical protein
MDTGWTGSRDVGKVMKHKHRARGLRVGNLCGNHFEYNSCPGTAGGLLTKLVWDGQFRVRRVTKGNEMRLDMRAKRCQCQRQGRHNDDQACPTANDQLVAMTRRNGGLRLDLGGKPKKRRGKGLWPGSQGESTKGTPSSKHVPCRSHPDASDAVLPQPVATVRPALPNAPTINSLFSQQIMLVSLLLFI